MLPNIGAPELIIILIIALVILGPRRLPEVGSSLGKSIREFRKASSDVQEAVSVDVDTSPLPATPAVPAASVAAAAAAAPIAAPVAAAPPAPEAPIAAAPAPYVNPHSEPMADAGTEAPTAADEPSPSAAKAADSTTVAS